MIFCLKMSESNECVGRARQQDLVRWSAVRPVPYRSDHTLHSEQTRSFPLFLSGLSLCSSSQMCVSSQSYQSSRCPALYYLCLAFISSGCLISYGLNALVSFKPGELGSGRSEICFFKHTPAESMNQTAAPECPVHLLRPAVVHSELILC